MRRSIVVISILVAVGTTLPFLCAQQGDKPVPISITVVDPSGAIAPGACVAIGRNAQDVRFSKETDASGKLVATLAPGGYDITVALSGFARTTKHLEVTSDSTPSLQIKLAIYSCAGPCLEVGAVASPPLDVDMESGKRRADLSASKADAKKCEACTCGSWSR